MPEKKNEIKKVEPAEIQATNISPFMPIIEAASTNGEVDADKLMKLVEASERWDANVARKSFAADFTAVQAKIEAVVNEAFNPQTKSKYAKLEGVIGMAKPIYTERGFSVIFYEGTTEKPDNIRVCADVLHGEGHKETYHYDVPLGGVGMQGKVNMTKIHGKATSVTYGRRYLMCMIWNIPTQDEDGNGAGDDPNVIPDPTPEEAELLGKICDKLYDSLPEGLILIPDKVAKMIYGIKGDYPDSAKKVGAQASYLINRLNENKSWHIVTREANA